MQEPVNIGIDVAKAELVIGVIDHPELNVTIANTAQEIKRWLRGVPVGSRLAVESTGGYHSLVVQLAQVRGLAAYVLNAKDVHFYAKALGQRGKTDRTDARVISRYLKEHHAHLHEFQPGSVVEQEINLLLRRRAFLVEQREALRMSFREAAALARPIKSLVKQFDQLLVALDGRIETLIASQEDLAGDAARLQTVPGIGPQGAALLTCLFRRIGFKSMDAVIAFSGLDPRPMDSGQKRGRRRLSKRGPAFLRRQVYLMGFSASRANVFKCHYHALRARGLSPTAAFVALGRKILGIAFAIWRIRDSTFDPKRYLPSTSAG